MPNRFEVIYHPNKFRLKPGIWVEPPGTTTEWPITTTTEEPDVQYVYYDDGIALWRKGVRDGCFVWDKALTPVGFNGIEDTDWENVRTLCPGESSATTDDGIIQYVIYYDGITLWRKGVRDGCFVWDRAITLTGFDGVEDTDWENVRMLCGVGTTTTESPGLGFGLLYNYYAAVDGRGISNTGWHVPTDVEFDTLISTVDPSAELYSNIAGGILKELGFVYWNTPNTGASNSSGFNARGAGMRSCGTVILGEEFTHIKEVLSLWTSTDNGIIFGYDSAASPIILYNNDYMIEASMSSMPKLFGLPIRLIKDSTSLTHGQTGTYVGNDGKVYRTICIGTQEWMADNLCETLYRNGDPIPEVTDNATWAALITGALCAYNNDWNNV